MTLSISKAFDFSASHVLSGLPAGHKCTRLHGHSYRVRLELWGEADEHGLLVEFGQLDWLRDYIATHLDHRHLNDVLPFNPTAELISSWLADQVLGWINDRPEADRVTAVAVGVAEGRMTWATTHIHT